MEAADKLLQKAKRLKPEELSELVARLDEYLSTVASEEISGSGPSYARSLALSGKGDSNWTDVSSHKGGHLAEVYAHRRER